MKMPAVVEIIERRLLVNYRVAPGALAGIVSRFPVGSTNFDCALVVRGIRHSWHVLPTLSHVTFNAPAA